MATPHVCCCTNATCLYTTQQQTSEWVPMRGVSSSLTPVELRSANDLNNIFPCPHPGGEPQEHSPRSLSTVSQPEMRLTQTVGSHPQTQRSGMSSSTVTGHTA